MNAPPFPPHLFQRRGGVILPYPSMVVVREMTPDGAALDAWIIDAETAVEYGHTLTAGHVLAIAAKPDSDVSLFAGHTWYLEEYARVFHAILQDVRPWGEPDPAMAEWRTRQDRAAAELRSLLHDNSEALAMARAFVAGDRRANPTRRKRERRRKPVRTSPSVERALRIVNGEAA